MDERELVELARAGDPLAFEEIYLCYERRIHNFVYRTMGNVDDADDITHDAFVKASKALPGIAPMTNLSAWLHRIASNCCLDVLRRRQRIRWLPWEGSVHDQYLVSGKFTDPDRMVVANEEISQVQDVMAHMSSRHRRVLIMREHQHMSCQEIGDEMGLSRSAVKSCLFRAREEFRAVYRRRHGEPQMVA